MGATMPDTTGQCSASSWRGSTKKTPYGPGGFNRCTRSAVFHEFHEDGFGQVFVTEPKFRVLRPATPGFMPDAPRNVSEADDPVRRAALGLLDEFGLITTIDGKHYVDASIEDVMSALAPLFKTPEK